MAIVKQIAMAHGGTVEVKSSIGRGTSITIQLPENQERAKSR